MLNKFISVSSLIPFLLLGLVGYWQFVDSPDQIHWGNEVSVSPIKVKPGTVVFLYRTVYVEKPVVVRFDRRLVQVDCQTRCKHYVLISSVRFYEKPEVESLTRALEIPSYVDPGKYKIEVTATWDVNPIKSYSRKLPSPIIEVEK